jgi:hypothetical protein
LNRLWRICLRRSRGSTEGPWGRSGDGSPRGLPRQEYGPPFDDLLKISDMTLDPLMQAENRTGDSPPDCSGNPAGKKAGTRHKATQAALALLSGEADGLHARRWSWPCQAT